MNTFHNFPQISTLYRATHPSRTLAGYCIEAFTDDFGNLVHPYKLGHVAYLSRRYFFKGYEKELATS
jgi:hypothetical protein